jgi:hypothetical protein
LAKAAFFLTGDSGRSRRALVGVRDTKGSLDDAPRPYPELALLATSVGGWRPGVLDRSVSLLLERVLMCRSGDDLVGL